LAAALFFLAFGLWSTGPVGIFTRPPHDPLLAQVMKHDVRLAAAQSSRERLDALSDLADVLQSDPRELVDAARPEHLTALAECYTKVVSDGIVPRALALRKEDQTADLDGIAARLLKTAEDAEALARVRPEASAEPFKSIAQAARKGESELPPHNAGAKALSRHGPGSPVLFASLALADLQGAPSAAARVELLRRNLGLIESVVQNSIALAGADNALNRADACGTLAKRLAEEIREAKDDPSRAIELAEYLKVVLKQGVAANLVAARPAIPSGSNDETRLYAIQDGTASEMRNLEKILPADGEVLDDLKWTLRAVQDGRAEVEKAVKRLKPAS
jgi:hypothetical protein